MIIRENQKETPEIILVIHNSGDQNSADDLVLLCLPPLLALFLYLRIKRENFSRYL